MKNKNLHWFIISTFVGLYLIVSIISTIHVVDFFRISNPEWLSIFLAIAFEVGAAASLSSIIVMEKMNKTLIWGLFIILTAMQAMGNTYYAYTHLNNFQEWIELFGLLDEDLIYQKRIISLISGAILPLVSLGFIKSLVDYIRPSEIEDLKEPGFIPKEEEILAEENLTEENQNEEENNQNPNETEEIKESVDPPKNVNVNRIEDPVQSYIMRIK